MDKELDEGIRNSNLSFALEEAKKRHAASQPTAAGRAAAERLQKSQGPSSIKSHHVNHDVDREAVRTTRATSNVEQLNHFDRLSISKNSSTPKRHFPQFSRHVDQTEHDAQMHELLVQMLDLTVLFMPRKRNGHCLFQCFEQYGNVITLRDKVVELYKYNPHFLDYMIAAEKDAHMTNMRCVDDEKNLRKTAGVDSYGAESEIIALARVCKISVITVAFSGTKNTDRKILTFMLYLSKEIDGEQKIRQISTNDVHVVKEHMHKLKGAFIVIGLVDGHWSLFELPGVYV